MLGPLNDEASNHYIVTCLNKRASADVDQHWRWTRAVSSTGVQKAAATNSAPDDHFTAGPDCRVSDSASGRVGGAGGCPTIRAGIVSPAGVQKIADCVSSTPDDHFTAGPHCRVKYSRSGRVGGAGGCPTIRAGIVSPAGVEKVAVTVENPPQTIISLPVQTAV